MDERKRTPQILKISYSSISLLLKVVLAFIFLVLFVGGWAFSQFPSDKEIKGCLVTEMYKVNLCPTSGSYVKLSQVSTYLQKSIVLTEDSSFWDHNGFDFQELENSFKKNIEEGKFARGGSTITQQLAKNMFLTKDKTLTRKAIEALITIRIEKVLTKKEILEKYLNAIQFGKNIFGIKNAAQFYFKKLPANLTIVESAFLTLLLPNPVVYAQSFHTKNLTPFAHKRLNQIIDRLYQYNRINADEFVAAKAELEYFLSQRPPEILELADEDDQTATEPPAIESTTESLETDLEVNPVEDIQAPLETEDSTEEVVDPSI